MYGNDIAEEIDDVTAEGYMQRDGIDPDQAQADYLRGKDVGKLGLSYDENETKAWQEGWCEGKNECDANRKAMRTCPGDCEPMCAWCNDQADIAADAIANGEYVDEY